MEQTFVDKTKITYDRPVPEPRITKLKLSSGIEPTDRESDGSPIAPWKIYYGKFMLFWSVAAHSFLAIQAVKIYSEKDSSGVSLPAYVLYLCSSCLWLIYGSVVLPRKNLVIIMSATTAIVLGAILLTGILLYR